MMTEDAYYTSMHITFEFLCKTYFFYIFTKKKFFIIIIKETPKGQTCCCTNAFFSKDILLHMNETAIIRIMTV